MSEQSTLEAGEVTAEPVMVVTDAALAKVLEVRDGEDDPAELALHIEVTDLAFTPVDELPADSHRWEVGDLQMAVGDESRTKLAGATLDLPSNPAQGGLIIRNPNRPNPLGDVGELVLEGEVPERIAQLLEQNVNPMLASHGGFATLVGVDGHTAYVTMGGGCQGCAMSQATLTEGIQRAILEAIPEIVEVVDATDHAAGDNPFFT